MGLVRVASALSVTVEFPLAIVDVISLIGFTASKHWVHSREFPDKNAVSYVMVLRNCPIIQKSCSQGLVSTAVTFLLKSVFYKFSMQRDFYSTFITHGNARGREL